VEQLAHGQRCRVWVYCWLEGFFGNRDVFPRRRVKPRDKALAVRLYHQASLRRVRAVLSELGWGRRGS